MSEINELKQLIKENLCKRGLLEKMKTEVKTEIFSVLNDDLKSDNKPKPKLSNENLLINDLIREYLDFNRYNFSSNILVSETGQPKTIMNRKFLCDQLNVTESQNSQSVPLLYSLLNYFTEQTDTKRLPTVSNPPKRVEQNNNALENRSYVNRDSDRSNMSDFMSDMQDNPMPKVYSARDFLRDRSSYSSSSTSKYDQ